MDRELQATLRKLQEAGLGVVTPEAIPYVPPHKLVALLKAALRAMPDDQLENARQQLKKEERRRHDEAECPACTHPRRMHEDGPPFRCGSVPLCACRDAWPLGPAHCVMPF
jgi:hypothetical protein